MRFIDMHTHSTASDGIFSPSKLVDYAIQKGLSGIAITDHDTTNGVDEAKNQASKYGNFIVIPGVEFSTQYNEEEVHILGYMIDYKMEHLHNMLQSLQKARTERAIKIINKLKELEFEVSYEDILKIANKGAIGRPHIARYLVQKGYVQTIGEAFTKYLVKGSLAYVPKQKLASKCAIDAIHKANGISVIAHPGLLKSKTTLKDLINIGIDGIEVYHPEHTIEQTEEFLKLTQKYNLIVTGGSDFHYPPKNNENKGELGNIKVSFESIKEILK